MRTKAFAFTVFLLIAIGISAYSQPSLGTILDRTRQAVEVTRAVTNALEEITPEQEYYIGRAVSANILSTYKIWNGNPALTSYLNLICTAITVNSPKPDVFNGYHVAILDSNEINAFATSGGHIFVTRGLIGAAKSEDALAAVIAHEVAHIQLQHGMKAIKTDRWMQAGSTVSGELFANTSVGQLTSMFGTSVDEVVTTMVNNGYSQSQEFEADNTAMSLLASAGYNPSALVDMLRELNTVQSSVPGGFNKTHPTPQQRITNAQRSVNSHRVTDTSQHRVNRFNALQN